MGGHIGQKEVCPPTLFNWNTILRLRPQEWSAKENWVSIEQFLQNLGKKSQKYCEPNKRILWDQGFLSAQVL